MTLLYRSVALCILFLSPAFAHEATYFMPQVPDPDQMIIDGRDDDWGWFDPAFAITPDELFQTINGAPWPVPATDWDCTLYVAWSSAPDNALYYFASVTDDSLYTLTENPQEYWKDDSLEIVIDADHSSEFFGETDYVSGQQYGVRILPAAGQSATVFYSHDMQWDALEPYFTFGWTLDPPDAKPLEQPAGTTVTYTYEVRQKIWTFRDPTGAAESIEHLFAPDQIIGLTFQFDEAENGLGGVPREHRIATTPENRVFQSNSFGSDFIAVPTEGATGGTAQTAVKASNWGRIKAYMKTR